MSDEIPELSDLLPAHLGAEGESEQMPEALVSDGGIDAWQREFEVVLAKNIYPPYRFSQEYYWLGVLAGDERSAVDTASRWVLENNPELECTDLVRETTPHYTQLALTGLSVRAITVSWGLPISKHLLPGQMVRDPVTGIRIGFLADEKNQQRFERASGRRDYRLILRKPAPSADWVSAAPVVTSVSPLAS